MAAVNLPPGLCVAPVGDLDAICNHDTADHEVILIPQGPDGHGRFVYEFRGMMCRRCNHQHRVQMFSRLES